MWCKDRQILYHMCSLHKCCLVFCFDPLCMARWPINMSRVWIPAVAGQVVNTCASVTKQYNLVPANGQWCLAAGKVTVGLALHWPRVRVVLHLRAQGLGEGNEHPPTLSCGAWSTLPYLYLYYVSVCIVGERSEPCECRSSPGCCSAQVGR